MTEQEIFDAVARHLLTQNAKSATGSRTDGSFGCMYRSPDGLKCAVGCLIPDDEYDPDIEEKSVEFLVAAEQLPAYLVPYVYLLAELQTLHDDFEVENWRKELRKIAAARDLSAKVLEEV